MNLAAVFERLHAALDGLAQGKLDIHSLDDLRNEPDPVGAYVAAFQQMAAAVLERENALRQHLLELTIQIDEDRAMRDAERIIQSERFQRIQGIVRKGRDKNGDPEEPTK